MTLEYKHFQGAHCETATIASLLNNRGMNLDEPTVFGIGAGIFFAYLPFIKVSDQGFPLVSFRAPPRAIIDRVGKRLGVKFVDRTFKDQDKAMAALDANLSAGIPTALQTGIYWLPYMPGAERFHFNGHNLIVYGKEGETYLISDPILPEPVRCNADDLVRARWAKGDMAPKGRMYYPTDVPTITDLRKPMRDGLDQAARMMLKVPFPLIGVRGIRKMAKVIVKWPEKLGPQKSAIFTGHLVLLLEEIGTGGAGFRFMYAAFLESAGRTLENEKLADASKKMTQIGDLWREFGLLASRTCKGRAKIDAPYERLAEILNECAEREAAVFSDIRKAIR